MIHETQDILWTSPLNIKMLFIGGGAGEMAQRVLTLQRDGLISVPSTCVKVEGLTP